MSSSLSWELFDPIEETILDTYGIPLGGIRGNYYEPRHLGPNRYEHKNYDRRSGWPYAEQHFTDSVFRNNNRGGPA